MRELRPTAEQLADTAAAVPVLAAALRDAAKRLERGEIGILLLVGSDMLGASAEGGLWCSPMGCDEAAVLDMQAQLRRVLQHFDLYAGMKVEVGHG